ncbi:MAG: mercuric reductase [Candidatus Sericytochromatia bacterium]|nr:mercuric reductase [Candidatus Sericytochromatia bacterium]
MYSVEPLDTHNRELLKHVHPENWQNPRPTGPYNLVVIGGGTAGLVSAAGAASLGAKVALIERSLMGGDCLNTGCVPSKAVIRSGRAAHDIRAASHFGIQSQIEAIDFAAAMGRMRQVRAQISHHDSFERFKNLGIDVYMGSARFINDRQLEVGGQTLDFKKAVIASGARARVPEIPGLAEAGYLTNENVFNLTALPQRLVCIGGGPIGCELAQAFHRLGAQVTLIHNSDHLLNREDPDAAAVVQAQFLKEGIQLILNAELTGVAQSAAGKTVSYRIAGQSYQIVADAILLATGRQPNVEKMGLEAAGVRFQPQGVEVNDHLQTSNPRIFAAGDVCMRWQFTHAADFAARIVLQNALFMGRKKLSSLLMPWCTYTDPEVAHVGLYAHEAKAQGIAVDIYQKPFAEVDRALADGETEGFVKVLTAKGSDRILGATVVARHAGDMLGELTLAIQHNIGLGKIASVIHPYPTQAEAIRHLGDQYNRTRLKPWVKNLFEIWLRWQR